MTRETLPFASANLQRHIIILLETFSLRGSQRFAHASWAFFTPIFCSRLRRQRGKVGSEVVEWILKACHPAHSTHKASLILNFIYPMHKSNICAISYNQRYRVRLCSALNSDDKRERFARVRYVIEQPVVNLDRYIKFAIRSENYLIPTEF